MARYKLLGGGFEIGRGPTRKSYKRGDVVESEEDLVARWGKIFQRVDEAASPAGEDVKPEEKRAPEPIPAPKPAPAAAQPAPVVTQPAPAPAPAPVPSTPQPAVEPVAAKPALPGDVSDRFPDAAKLDLRVVARADKAERFDVIDPEAPGTPINKEPLTGSGVKRLLKQYVGA